MEHEQADPGRLVLWAVIFEGGLAIAAIGIGYLVDYHPLEHFRWTWPAAGWGAVASLPPLGLMIGCTRVAWGPCRSLTRLVEEQLVPLFVGCTLLDLAMISLVAGLGEEFLFRGVVQGALAERYHPALGLIAGSVVFGIAHPLSRSYVVMATLMGFYLGAVLILTENLLAPVIAHALYDFLALVYLLRGSRAGEERGA